MGAGVGQKAISTHGYGSAKKLLFRKAIRQKAAGTLKIHHSLTSSFTEGMFTLVLFMIVKNWKQLKYPAKGYLLYRSQ